MLPLHTLTTRRFRPFSNPLVKLEFDNGSPLAIHRKVVLRNSQLALLCDASTETIPLQPTSSNAGHSIVHYLYTGSLDTLGWGGIGSTSVRKPEAVRLTTVFKVYAASRRYGLEDL